jgi:PAS domain-containing protein
LPSQTTVTDRHWANYTILIAKDRSETPIDDSAAPIRQTGGPIFGIVLVVRDFTERKQKEATLQSLALLPSQNPIPVLRVGGSGQLLYVNPAKLEKLYSARVTIPCGLPTGGIPPRGCPDV